MAGGMARRGALPVVHSFACFLAARPNEQIYNQCSERSKVIYVGSLAGLLPGGPGHSHQSVRDISALAAVPGLVMAEPQRRGRSGAAPRRARGRLPSSALPASGVGEVADAVRLSGRATASRSGRAGSRARAPTRVVFGYGPWMLANALQAAEDVRGGAPASRLAVVALPWLNRVDAAWLRETIGARRAVVTLDNHYVHGGQGEMLAAAIAALGLDPAVRVTRIGVDVAARVRHQRRGAGRTTASTSPAWLSRLRDGARAGADAARWPDPSHDGSVLGHRRHAADHRQGRHVRVGRRREGDHRPRLPAGVDAHPGHDRLSDCGAHVRDARARADRGADSTSWCAATRSCCRPACRASTATCCRTCARSSSTCAIAADVRSYLLTGNTRGGATGQADALRAVDFFPDGAFAEDARERATIAARAMAAGARGRAGVARHDVFVIGDTPHDIECANAIGVRTIAVATGGYTWTSCAPHRAVAAVRRAAGAATTSCGSSTSSTATVQPESRARHEARHPPRARRCGGRRGWHGAGITPGATPIPTGSALLVGRAGAVGVGARRAATGGPRVLMATLHRLLRPRRHARERARGGADVPRRRGARAAVRRGADGVRRVRGVALSRTSTRSCAAGPHARSVPRLPVAGRARLPAAGAHASTATATG